ncbi:MAG: hypothetical protein HN509_08140, partial [Halobacteriovoraceae bacterium]|nr:hypothetical protein [Halobacteriovoraceae bacterium]
SLSSLPGKIQQVKGQIAALKKKVAGLKSTVAGLRTQQAAKKAEVAALMTQIKKLRSGPQSDAIKVKIKQLMGEVRAKRQVLNKLRNQIKQSNATIASLESQLGTKKSELQTLKGQSDKLLAKLAGLEQKLPGLRSQLKQVTSQIPGARSQVTTAEAAVNAASGEIRPLRQVVKEAKTRLDAKKGELATVKTAVARAKSQLSGAKTKMAALVKKKQNIETELPKLAQKLVALDRKVKAARQNAKALKQQLVVAENELGQIQQRADTIANRLARLSNEISTQQNVVATLENRITSMQNNMANLQGQANRRITEVDQNSRQILENQNQMSANSQAISSMQSENSELHRAIASLEQEISELERRLIAEDQRFQSADRIAQQAEAVTAADLAQFEKRSQLYRKFQGQAQSLGAGQGDRVGGNSGAGVGDSEGQSSGQKNGQRIGKEIAELDGLFRGFVKGKISGDAEGYHAGETSQVDYSAGLAAGKKIGLKKAIAEAKRINYPQGYAAKRGQLLAAKPQSSTIVSNGNKGLIDSINSVSPLFFNSNKSLLSSDQLELEKGLEDFSIEKGDSDVTEEEILAARAIRSQIDSQVELTLEKIESYNSPERDLSAARVVYLTPAGVNPDMSAVSCVDVYKGVQDFVDACLSSFRFQYVASYNSEHKDKFFQVYSDVYGESRSISFSHNKDNRFVEGKEDAYGVVYPEAKARGAVVAQNRGIADGKVQGYENNIEEQRSSFTAKGKSDATAYFANNGVIRLDGKNAGSLEATSSRGLTQGSKGKLILKLSNLGHKVSKTGEVTLRLRELTNNIRLEKRALSTVDLPARKNITLKDVVSLTVGEDAVPGSPIKIAATLIYKGDDISASFKEELLLTDFVKVNPEVASSVSAESEVKWRKWKVYPFSWKFRTVAVQVNIKGLRNNVPGHYDVKFEVLTGGKYLKVNTPAVKVAAMGRGQVGTANLSYTFTKKAKKKKFSFKATVSYQGEELFTQTFNVKTVK